MSTIYEIRIEGHLGETWSEWFEGLTIVPLPNGETLLFGKVADQPALHGMLNRIRDLNLKLVSIDKKQELP